MKNNAIYKGLGLVLLVLLNAALVGRAFGEGYWMVTVKNESGTWLRPDWLNSINSSGQVATYTSRCGTTCTDGLQVYSDGSIQLYEQLGFLGDHAASGVMRVPSNTMNNDVWTITGNTSNTEPVITDTRAGHTEWSIKLPNKPSD